METASLYEAVEYGDSKPKAKVLFDTADVKELRIVFRRGQEMREHRAPFPIVVEIVDGSIDFGAGQERLLLEKGKLIALPANVPHDLRAVEDSIVRLSLHASDRAERPLGI